MQITHFASIVLFATSLTHFSIGFAIFLKNKNNKVNITFFILSLTLVLWTLFYGITYLTKTDYQTLFWTRILTIPTFFYPSIFLYLALIFPKNEYKMGHVFISYHFLFILVFLSFLFTKYHIYSARLVPQGIDFEFGIAYNILGFYIITTMFYGCYVLIKKLLILRGKSRSQVIYVCTGAFLSIIVGATFGVILPIIKIPHYNFFGPAGTIFVICFWGYAITKHRLMNISVVISRSLAWTLTVLFLGSIYAGLVWLYRTFVTTQINTLFLAWTILYGILVGETFQRIRLFLQTTTDRAFIKDWYDYQKVLKKLVSELSKAFSRADIIKTIFPIFNDDIDISDVHIYFADQETNNYLEWDPKTGEPKKDLALTMEDHLVKQVLMQRDIVAFDGKTLIPCFVEDDLVGIFVLGKKRSEDNYTDEDIELFKIISEYVARVEVTRKELERSHKLAALGTLSAGIAHEIRNPMMVLSSKAQMVPGRLEDKEYVAEFAQTTLRQIDRILGIMNRMLRFAKAKEEGLLKINANELLEDTLALLDGKIKDKGIAVAKELKAKQLISGNPDALAEAFMNFILNAISFMDQGGVLTVKTEEKDKKIAIEIKDTGAGIPQDKLEHIFDPFFTTRAEGTGLGLSVAHKTIQEHKGEIKVASEVGRGSTFTILLPSAV